MCGAHSQAPHIRPIPPFWASLLVGCAQNRSSLYRRIWQRGLDGRRGPKLCGWSAGMSTVSAAEIRNWIISSDNTGLTYAC